MKSKLTRVNKNTMKAETACNQRKFNFNTKKYNKSESTCMIKQIAKIEQQNWFPKVNVLLISREFNAVIYLDCLKLLKNE